MTDTTIKEHRGGYMEYVYIQSSIVYSKACEVKPPSNIVLGSFCSYNCYQFAVVTITMTVYVTTSVLTKHVAMKRLSFQICT